MPVKEYFGGKGEKVMKDMKARYGEEKGESVFYGTAEKKGQKPKSIKMKAAMRQVMSKPKGGRR